MSNNPWSGAGPWEANEDPWGAPIVFNPQLGQSGMDDAVIAAEQRRHQAPLPEALMLELAEWEQAGGAGLGPFYTVDLFCGHCMVHQRGKAHPSKKIIGRLECWGSDWYVAGGLNSEAVDSEYAPNVTCPRCGFQAQVTASHRDLTTFFLLRAQRRKRQSLAFMVEHGLARQDTPPSAH